MADELELELDLDLEEEPIINKTEERIKNLSSKVREKAQETQTEREGREAAEARAETAEKRAEFLESFSDVSTKYPGATEFKTQIEERVQKGYSIEDAAVAVLASEGKFTPSQDVAPTTDSTIGGSAATPSLSGENRPFSEMSRDEKREKLLEADRNGELKAILEQRR